LFTFAFDAFAVPLELTFKEESMKRSIKISVFAVSILAAVLIAFGSLAADPGKKAASPKQQAQYEKMRVCNAEAKAKGLKGDERKAFMSECLKKKPDEDALDAPVAKAEGGEKPK
jgi:hypothetical protein